MAELVGATAGMAGFGYLLAWLIRKLAKMSVVTSYCCAVVFLTVISGGTYSLTPGRALLEGLLLYSAAGAIALPLMIIAHRQRAEWTGRD